MSLEVHILDFNQDIYGQQLEVKMLKKIRNEQRFASPDALKQQIGQDVIKAQHYFLQAATTPVGSVDR